MNINVRPVLPGDSIEDIAKCIYKTDDYIYPYIFKTADDPEWIKFIKRSLKNPNSIFYKENIIVAVCNDTIIGLVCMVPCGKRLVFAKKNELPDSAVNEKYFQPLINHIETQNGYFLNNIFVEDKFRGKGIGYYILKEALKIYVGVVHTEVIADNKAAVNLYAKHGFKSTEVFQGFSGAHPDGIKCIKLIKCF